MRIGMLADRFHTHYLRLLEVRKNTLTPLIVAVVFGVPLFLVEWNGFVGGALKTVVFVAGSIGAAGYLWTMFQAQLGIWAIRKSVAAVLIGENDTPEWVSQERKPTEEEMRDALGASALFHSDLREKQLMEAWSANAPRTTWNDWKRFFVGLYPAERELLDQSPDVRRVNTAAYD